MRCAAGAMLLALLCVNQMSCGSGTHGLAVDDPTSDRPRIGCIADSPLPQAQIRNRQSCGRVLPEIVRIVGTYLDADGVPMLDEYGNEQWKILRAGEFNPEHWQPWSKKKIQTMGCGPEGDALQLMLQPPQPAPRNDGAQR